MNVSYFATREFFSTAMHAVTCIGIPIHFFGAYCIIFVTPESMKSVKWSMLNLHVWSVMLDWGLSFLTCPFVLIPTLAGLPIGILTQLGVKTDIQYYLCNTLFSIVNVSIVMIVENRYYLLFARNHWWRIARVPFLISNYFLGITYFIVPFLLIPNQESAAELMKKENPELPSFVFESSLFILDLNPQLFAIVFLFEFTVIIETLVFGYLIVRNLKKRARRTSVSSRTIRLQKKFLRALLIQILTPFIILITPLFYFGPAVFFKIYNQSLNNICVVIISMHGLTSTLIMLFIHDPYRCFCWRVLSGKLCNKRTQEAESAIVLTNLNQKLSICQVGTGFNLNYGFHQF